MADAGSIFLNYRREESQWVAGRLHDRLAAAFGKERIFTDVDSIGPGQDFTKALEAAVGNCRVLLAIIGPNWTKALDEAGRRRLENPHDWVRFEIETALGRAGVLVIPVLTDNAPMPQPGELPGELAQLSVRQAFKISADGFSRDVADLVKSLQSVFNPPAPQPSSPSQPTPHQTRQTAQAHRGMQAEEDRIRAEPKSPEPQARPRPVPRESSEGAQPLVAHRNIAVYWRFWIGLLLIGGGSVALLARVPHKIGYGPLVNVAKADTYFAVGLTALIILGVLLLIGAAVSSGRAASAPRDQR